MAQTKTEMASSVSNQQALVKRLIGNNRPKPSKTVIPGGQSILDEVDQTMLERAVFNYLRRHRYFETFKLSFAKAPETMELQVEKIQDFPYDGKYAIWEIPAQGKSWLAEQIAGILARQQLVYIEAKYDGLYVATEKKKSDFGPGNANWEPYYEMLPSRKSEYAPSR
jgi:hypothetical protein